MLIFQLMCMTVVLAVMKSVMQDVQKVSVELQVTVIQTVSALQQMISLLVSEILFSFLALSVTPGYQTVHQREMFGDHTVYLLDAYSDALSTVAFYNLSFLVY